MKDGFIKTAAATPHISLADPKKNADTILDMINTAAADGVKALVFPELCICGYTCADLFLQPLLLSSCEKEIARIVKETAELDIISIIGAPVRLHSSLYNCAIVIYKGDILGIVPKSNLPGYGEFYESRYFVPASDTLSVLNYAGQDCLFGTDIIFSCKAIPEFSFAVEICEDLWVAASPSVRHTLHGATIIFNLSAGCELVAKADYRRVLVQMQAAKLLCVYVYAGAGEGESTTDSVFSGHRIVAEGKQILSESDLFSTGITSAEIDVARIASKRRKTGRIHEITDDSYETVYFNMPLSDTELTINIPQEPFIPSDETKRHEACRNILNIQAHGLKRRLEASYAKKAVIGISGGLDSCLALLAAARAMDISGRERTDILAVTMPCFGTTSRTKSNAEKLCNELGVDFAEVDITKSTSLHLEDIGLDADDRSVTYENAQARERTQVLMDIANKEGGIVVGTGDLSELALGWATYNGDHMSMYGVNAGIPKTLIRHIVKYCADTSENPALKEVLYDILDTPVSPELLPADDDSIVQKTEDIVGPYTLHDFYLYYGIHKAFPPKKVYRIAKYAFDGKYDDETLKKWLKVFYKRFFAQQFKRSCLPDGPKVGSLSLSPRSDFRMPSDATASLWLSEAEEL